MQSIIATMDHRTNSFDSISRRTIAELDCQLQELLGVSQSSLGQNLSSAVGPSVVVRFLMTPQDFAKNSHFSTNGWKPADYGLAMLGANLMVEDQVSS